MSSSLSGNLLVLWAAASLAVMLAAGWGLAALERRRGRRLHSFAENHLLARLIVGYLPGLRRSMNALVLLGLGLVLVAIAEPRWGEEEFDQRRGSREILVLLDTSESMNAVDPPPSRLARAQQKVVSLLETHPGDRFGLIAFSGAAVLECPLTRDQAYFKTVLQSVTTDTLTAEGTDIESALVEAEKLFQGTLGRDRGATREDRIVLLLSDGETVSGDAVAAAGRLAEFAHVVVMGIGNPEGAEIRLPQWMERSRYAPQSAAPHWSVLDEENLSAIALAGDGVYVRSTLSDDDIDVIARELATLEGIGGDRDSRRTKVNRYRWPLAAALCCFAAEGGWLVVLPLLARRRVSVLKDSSHAPA